MTIERGPELGELLNSRFVQCYYEAVIVPMKMRSSFEPPFNALIGRLTLLWPLMIEPLVPRQHRRPLIIVTTNNEVDLNIIILIIIIFFVTSCIIYRC